jgi:hypothetical protein
MSSVYSVLPMQPYNTMGFVLIEYDVRVHPWVPTVGGIGYGQNRMVECFF